MTTEMQKQKPVDVPSRIIFWGSLVMTTVFIVIPMAKALYDYRNAADTLREEAAKGSSVHQFVVNKYLDCRAEFLSPSRDECVARVMLVARTKGAQFEQLAGYAVRDLKLNQ